MDSERPAIVYLDYNVMVFLFDGRLPDLRACLDEHLQRGDILVPFAREHVVESMRDVDGASDEVRARAWWLLDEMSALTGDLYFLTDLHTDELRLVTWHPREVYQETVAPQALDDQTPDAADPLLRAVFQVGVAMWAGVLAQIESAGTDLTDLRERLDALLERDTNVQQASDELMQIIFTAISRSTHHLDAQGFSPSRMNNETTESVSSKIDEKLTQAGSLDLQGIQTWIAENAPKLGNHPIAGHLGMVGTFGYNRDKASTGAASRISDLGHANLGLRADVFVTDDRRLRNKAGATVHELELGVVVAGVDDAIQAIAEVVEKGRR
jgi:hypothetical protein